MGILYKPTVLGKGGRTFTLYKFRTMREGSEGLEAKLAQCGRDQYGKVRDDPRITRLGRILRRYWIDELPQLLNWARGDMTLVGLRPLTEEQWADYPQELKDKALKVKPGLIPPAYSQEVGTFEDLIALNSRYLEEKRVDPASTDCRYLKNFVRNVFKKGIRSK